MRKTLMLWNDVPEWLRLDPARAWRIYGQAMANPIERAEKAIELYYAKDNVCMFATNGLLKCWGYEFYERCRIPIMRGCRNVCGKHFSLLDNESRHLLCGYETVVRGETDPDVIEREWAKIDAKTTVPAYS